MLISSSSMPAAVSASRIFAMTSLASAWALGASALRTFTPREMTATSAGISTSPEPVTVIFVSAKAAERPRVRARASKRAVSLRIGNPSFKSGFTQYDDRYAAKVPGFII